jgi:hypothetical protein
MKRLLALLVIVISLIVAIFVYTQYNKKHENLKNSEADFMVSAIELFNAYTTDEMAANKKYLNKVVEISGVVSKVESSDNAVQIFLETGDPLFGINCDLAGDQVSDGIEVGSEITLRGICTGYLMDVALSRCVIAD